MILRNLIAAGLAGAVVPGMVLTGQNATVALAVAILCMVTLAVLLRREAWRNVVAPMALFGVLAGAGLGWGAYLVSDFCMVDCATVEREPYVFWAWLLGAVLVSAGGGLLARQAGGARTAPSKPV